MLSFRRILSLVALCVLASSFARAAPKELELTLQTRDSKNKQVVQSERVASNKVGVVIVDPWNYHWCMTACERVSAIVALEPLPGMRAEARHGRDFRAQRRRGQLRRLAATRTGAGRAAACRPRRTENAARPLHRAHSARRPHRGRPARLRPHHGRARIDAIEVVLPGAANFQR